MTCCAGWTGSRSSQPVPGREPPGRLALPAVGADAGAPPGSGVGDQVLQHRRPVAPAPVVGVDQHAEPGQVQVVVARRCPPSRPRRARRRPARGRGAPPPRPSRAGSGPRPPAGSSTAARARRRPGQRCTSSAALREPGLLVRTELEDLHRSPLSPRGWAYASEYARSASLAHRATRSAAGDDPGEPAAPGVGVVRPARVRGRGLVPADPAAGDRPAVPRAAADHDPRAHPARLPQGTHRPAVGGPAHAVAGTVRLRPVPAGLRRRPGQHHLAADPGLRLQRAR